MIEIFTLHVIRVYAHFFFFLYVKALSNFNLKSIGTVN